VRRPLVGEGGVDGCLSDVRDAAGADDPVDKTVDNPVESRWTGR
jgi:hypothetical protein